MIYTVITERPEKAGAFTFSYSAEGSYSATLKDSFDYLLLNKGMCLFEKADGGAVLYTPDGVREFRNIVDGELTKLTGPVLRPRVLMDRHEISFAEFGVSMLDELEKTVAKGHLTEIETETGRACMLRLEPLRGYSKETGKGAAAIKGAENAGSFGEAVALALKSTGDKMLSYSAKPSLSLSPDMPLYEVMLQIYTHLIDVMRVNTDGIVNDIDIEFLHDFRVSVRRLRSAMSLIRGVYDKAGEKEFRGRFRELGGLTGMARDMDVYLDKMPVYDSMLPEWLKGGMSELANHFAQTRTEEYRKLGAYISSGEFDKLAADWTAFIGNKKNVTKKGRKDVLPEAKRAIWQAFREIEKQASVLDEDSHSDLVHEIRISFKKIRYLLEFYSSLFDKEKISPMLKDMKVLQDSLGDHNDYHVQQLTLESLIESGKWSSKTASACGYLTAVLAEMQAAERKRALHLILRFMGYKELFGELFS